MSQEFYFAQLGILTSFLEFAKLQGAYRIGLMYPLRDMSSFSFDYGPLHQVVITLVFPLLLRVPLPTGKLPSRIFLLNEGAQESLQGSLWLHQLRGGRQPLPFWGLTVCRGKGDLPGRRVQSLVLTFAKPLSLTFTELFSLICFPIAFLFTLDQGSLYLDPRENTWFS